MFVVWEARAVSRMEALSGCANLVVAQDFRLTHFYTVGHIYGISLGEEPTWNLTEMYTMWKRGAM